MKKKIFFIIVFILFVFSFSTNIYAEDSVVTQINFANPAQAININTLSSVFEIQTQNISGESIQAGETTHLILSSDSTTGQFYDANSTACTDVITDIPLKLSMNSNWAKRHFCYEDSNPGVYTINISADGKSWTPATQKITVVDNSKLIDTIAPVITLNGDANISLNVHDTYTETVTATDDVDGDITQKIITTGTVDTSTAGTYTIAYDVSDIAGNKATTITRTIQVNTVSSGGNGGGYGGNPELMKNIHLAIETKDGFIINKDISVVPCDDKGIESITAYCALDQLEKSGILPIKSDWSGLWINSINGIVNNENNNGIYWMWLVNSNTTPNPAGFSCSQDYPYSCSAKEYFLKNNDQILFYYKPFVDPADDSKQEFITPASGGGGSFHILNNKFDVDKALAYLISKQNSDGSFSSDLYTDWAGIAIASTNNNLVSKEKVTNYLKTTPLISSTLTDNERHAMALLALGINPYNGTEINYIKKITDSFDGTQFGDENLVNDDIFAIFPLIKAGYNIDDEMIQKDISFIISKQGNDGSWGSVDLTAVAVQALSPFSSASGVSGALSSASSYLQNAQGNDGGWGNISSSSWATQAMNVLGESWVKEGKTATDYFNAQQETDGAVLPSSETLENRIWATSYVVPAMMSKPWGDIMQSFQKPDDHVFCPKGDLFSTTTGQACTATNETDFIVSNIPITNPNLSLVKKIENKKNVETPQEKNIKKPSSQIFGSPTSKTSVENNLGASVGNTVPIKISVKKILQVVSHLVISILTYIGKGFVDLIIFLQNQIVAIFK